MHSRPFHVPVFVVYSHTAPKCCLSPVSMVRLPACLSLPLRPHLLHGIPNFLHLLSVPL